MLQIVMKLKVKLELLSATNTLSIVVYNIGSYSITHIVILYRFISN